MPEYLSPGVYVEEVDAGPVPIEGVSTSTCGAVGFTLRGPSTGKPVLVTSYTEFVRTFGGEIPDPPEPIMNKWGDGTNPEGGSFWQFPLSVKGFFDNGGQRMFVKRVFSSNAAAASGMLGKGLVAEITRDSPDGKSLVLSHLFGIQNGTSVTVWVGGAAQTASTVSWYDGANNTVVLQTALGKPIKAGRDFVVIQPRAQATGGVIATATDQRLTIDALQLGAWANGLSVRFRPMVGTTLKLAPDPTQPQDPTTIVSTHYAAPTIVLAVGAVTPAAASFNVGDYVMVNGETYKITALALPSMTLQTAGNSHADPQLDNTMKVLQIDTASGPPATPATAPVVSQTSFTDGDWTITVADASKYVPTPTAHVLIAGEEYVLKSVAAATNTLTIDRAATSRAVDWGVSFAPGTALRRARPALASGTTLHATGADQLYVGALLELDNGINKEWPTVTNISGNTVTITPGLTKSYSEGDLLRVMEGQLTAQFGTQSETINDLPFTNAGQDLAAAINAKSKLVNVTPAASFPASFGLGDFPTIPQGDDFNGNWLVLDGGDDDLGGLKVDDFVGVDGGSGKRTGIQALEDIDEIALCVVPGMWSETVQSALITHCETLRYRFGILDPPDGLGIQDVQSFRGPYDTRFAALYYPWIRVRDPQAGTAVDLAPSGHMAGIYARVDDDRGVYKAPANEVIQGIQLVGGLAADVNKREQDILNPIGINALRFFTDRGQRVWGARTLSSDEAWKYISVKRLFIYVEHSLDKGTQWVVFEPNDETTWARVRQSIENFLTTVWHEGGLQGAKPSEAFFVRCDLTTMSQDDIDNGRMIILVGIAPVKPAEFVIIRIQQKTLDQQAP